LLFGTCFQDQPDVKKEEKPAAAAVNDVRLHAVAEDQETKKEVVTSPTGSPPSAVKPLVTKQKGAEYVAVMSLPSIVFQLQFTVQSELLLSVAASEILI